MNYFALFLTLYFILYFGIAFVWTSVQVAKRIGKSPLVLPKDDSTYGLVGLYFKITLILMFLYVISGLFLENSYHFFTEIGLLNHREIQYGGIALLIFALIETVIAQQQMRNSWRIGIDTETPTELITEGIYRYSRNPIFLGMIISLLGLFLCTPNACTALFLVLGYVLIQVQVRLEEEFLEKSHGEIYRIYKSKTARFI